MAKQLMLKNLPEKFPAERFKSFKRVLAGKFDEKFFLANYFAADAKVESPKLLDHYLADLDLWPEENDEPAEQRGVPAAPRTPQPNAPVPDPGAEALAIIRQSGLFDAAWYLETYADLAELDIDALEHFYSFGYLEG